MAPSSSKISPKHELTVGQARPQDWPGLAIERTPLASLEQSLNLIAEHLAAIAERLNTSPKESRGYLCTRTGQINYDQNYLMQAGRLGELSAIKSLWGLLDHRLSQVLPADNASTLVKEKLAAFIKQSPFVEYCSGNYGRPGSPEVIDMFTNGKIPRQLQELYLNKTELSITPLGALLHYMHIHTPAAEAHRLRLNMFRAYLKDRCNEGGHLNYLSFGTGNGFEFDRLKRGKELFSSTTLVGTNIDSLKSTSSALEQMGAASPKLIEIDAKQLLTTGPKLRDCLSALTESQELISCLGAFDYIPKRTESDSLVTDSIRTQLECLKTSGIFVASFIMRGNPHKAVLRDLLNWKLNHRTIEDLASIGEQLGFSPFKVEADLPRGIPAGLSSSIPNRLQSGEFAIVRIDPLGVNCFLVIKK